MSQSLVVLAQMFMIAVLLEQALAVLFNWRVFLSTFNARGVKTIVAVLAAWWLVSVLDLDLVAKLLKTYGTDAKEGALSTSLLTAFILAGGSSGVNNLLVALGFRSMRTADQIAPKPPKTEAWIAVRLVRDKAVGSVTVSIGPAGSAALPVAGIIVGASPKNRLARLFLVDRGRFPEVAGYAIAPQSGTAYLLQLEGRDKGGQSLSTQWGPHALAPGAIIDLELRL